LISWRAANLLQSPSAPPDNPPSFIIWMIEQAVGQSAWTRIGLFIFGWYFFVTIAITWLRRLNEGAVGLSEVITRTASQPVSLLKDLLAGLAGALLLLLGALWGLSTLWVATKLGSYVADGQDSVGPMGGAFPLNVISGAYLLIAALNVLLSLWMGFGSGAAVDGVIDSDTLSFIWLFPVLIMLPIAVIGVIDVIAGPTPQHFWSWLTIFVLHFGGWLALPLTWAGMRGLVKYRVAGRKMERWQRETDDAADRRVTEMRQHWAADSTPPWYDQRN